jgi:glycerophosphoryl diester phosphodiesterase
MFLKLSILLVLLMIESLFICNHVAQPLIVAHRGAMAYAPENTLAAFRKAIELGSDVLELDLRQTKDGIPVALHDASVNRTTNGKGNILNFDFQQLKELDAGSWFSSDFKNEKIPSLLEVMEILNDTLLLIIEFKGGNDTYPDIEENVVSIIRKNKIESQTILKAFDPNILKRLREIAPEIALLYVYTFRIPWLGMIIDTGITFGSIFNMDVEYIQPHRFFLSHSFVKKAQLHGFKVVTWGVNSISAIEEAVEFGVDGIETDYPDRVKFIINERAINECNE